MDTGVVPRLQSLFWSEPQFITILYRMRRLIYIFSVVLLNTAHAQEDCLLFNFQELVYEIQNTTLDTGLVQTDGSIQVQLSNGNAFQLILGCTNSAAGNYDPDANIDDGSCAPNCESPTMDAYSYDVVSIGDQCWFAENLRTTHYADGTSISHVTDPDVWKYLNDAAYCNYNNAGTGYGRLYNFLAVTDAAGLCPNGWHVPSDEEWTTLATFISSQSFSPGIALKSSDDWNGNCSSCQIGFEAVPGGFRAGAWSWDHIPGEFYGLGSTARYWSAGEHASYVWLNNYNTYYLLSTVARDGNSVRCLKDSE